MSGMRIWHLPLAWFLLQIFFSAAQPRQTDGSCGEYQFQCDSGQCVKDSVQCDGARDCEDGSDETVWLCRKLDLKCPPSSFRCSYGACVNGDALCNGIKDCADNSDELHPNCFKANLEPVQKNLRCDALYNFTCLSGECVDSVAVCDGQVDCKDGSDETLTQCYNMICQPNSFQCAYGGCIDGNKLCDGFNDCVDETDELPGFCSEGEQPVQKGSTVGDDQEGCLLPAQPRYGKYTLGGCSSDDESDYCLSEPGTKMQPYTQISYDCKRGYVLPVYSDGETMTDSFCIGNTWSNNITCRKMCEPVFSETLDLKCDFYGKPVPCDQYTRPGTKLMPKCKPLYHPHEPVTVYRHTRCMDDGEWEDPLFKCIPDSAEGSKDTSKKSNSAHSISENPSSNETACKECHSSAPPMSDRVLLCLALINAGIPVARFGSGSSGKVGRSLPNPTEHMTKAVELLNDLFAFIEHSSSLAYVLEHRRRLYTCHDAPTSEQLLSETQARLFQLEETILSQANPPEKRTTATYNNVLADKLNKKMGNTLQEDINICEKFFDNGPEDLLEALHRL